MVRFSPPPPIVFLHIVNQNAILTEFMASSFWPMFGKNGLPDAGEEKKTNTSNSLSPLDFGRLATLADLEKKESPQRSPLLESNLEKRKNQRAFLPPIWRENVHFLPDFLAFEKYIFPVLACLGTCCVA